MRRCLPINPMKLLEYKLFVEVHVKQWLTPGHFSTKGIWKKKETPRKTYSKTIDIIIAEVLYLRKKRCHFTRAQKLPKLPATPSIFDKHGWMRKNNRAARAARAARTFAQFFDVVCQMTTWNFQIKKLKSSSCPCSHPCLGFLLLVLKQPTGNWALTLKHFSLVVTDSVRKKQLFNLHVLLVILVMLL